MVRALGRGLHCTSILHPTFHTNLEDHLLTSAGGSPLWETGLLVSVSRQGERHCPPSRDMGPLGQGCLWVPSGLIEVALVRGSPALMETCSPCHLLYGHSGRRIPKLPAQVIWSHVTEWQPVECGQKS